MTTGDLKTVTVTDNNQRTRILVCEPGDTFADIFKRGDIEFDSEKYVITEWTPDEVGPESDGILCNVLNHVRDWDDKVTPGRCLLPFPREIWEKTKEEQEKKKK